MCLHSALAAAELQRVALPRTDLVLPEELVSGLITLGLKTPGQAVEPESDCFGGRNDTSYAQILHSRLSFPGEREYWQRALEGQTVVDLAAGHNPFGYLLACAAGARAYVGVEAYHFRALAYNLTNRGLEHWAKGLRAFDDSLYLPSDYIPRAVAPEDMLTFLRRLPDNSVSVLAIGLHYLLEGLYLEQVRPELTRVISQRGCSLSYPDSSAAVPLEYECQRIGCLKKFTPRF